MVTDPGETEYGLKAIPLGGYVRLVGMYPPGDPRAERKTGRIAELIQSARDASTEEIVPGEEHRAFYNLSAPKKLVVMLGGPFMNLVIAAVLFTAVVVGFGTFGPTTTLASVSQCVLPVGAPSDAECTEGSELAPLPQQACSRVTRSSSSAGRPRQTGTSSPRSSAPQEAPRPTSWSSVTASVSSPS